MQSKVREMPFVDICLLERMEGRGTVITTFEWNRQFFVDMLHPFGLRTAPRIFNLFAEALHWVFETLYEWNLMHYLDDFLFAPLPNRNLHDFCSI
jgi:hypothetical protein